MSRIYFTSFLRMFTGGHGGGGHGGHGGGGTKITYLFNEFSNYMNMNLESHILKILI